MKVSFQNGFIKLKKKKILFFHYKAEHSVSRCYEGKKFEWQNRK